MEIVLLPLDERPVNTSLPQAVAAIAGAQVLLPPTAALPDFRQPGDVDALADWMRDATAGSDAAVVSTDMLMYGGLIPSRTSPDDTVGVLKRLGLLREIRAARPEIAMLGVSLVMRASDSYSAEEEPLYWSELGREIHAFGGQLHRLLEGDGGQPDSGKLADHSDELLDFEQRRVRNHVANLHCLSEAAGGLFDLLLLTSDDTAPFSAGSAEVKWLEHWRRALPGAHERTLLHPGADEVGAILVSNAIASRAPRKPRVRIVADIEANMGVVPAYENRPIHLAARSQVAAAGGETVEEGDADLWLIIHTPDPRRQDWYGTVVEPDPAAAQRTAELVLEAKRVGALSVVADVRQTNGGDPEVLEALRRLDALSSVDAYGGWNTAGNALGSAVAAGVVAAAARLMGTLDETAMRRLVAHRLLEDIGYQSGLRRSLLVASPELGDRSRFSEQEEEFKGVVTDELNKLLGACQFGDWQVTEVRFPWHRSFEVDFNLRRPGTSH